MIKAKVTTLHAIRDTVGRYRKNCTHSQPRRLMGLVVKAKLRLLYSWEVAQVSNFFGPRSVIDRYEEQKILPHQVSDPGPSLP
jgi:hypothetical protein